MTDILKISLVFLSMLFLLRLKWNIGYVMLFASALLFMLYRSPAQIVLTTVKTTLVDPVTIKLFFSLTLIRVLEIVLRERQVMAAMTEASRTFLRNRKAVIVSMPMVIGLLPSLGGAYFSAPMVAESTKDLPMTPEEKGFINYWFRHPWECILPLYPGIILAAAITRIELRSLISANMIVAALIVVTGLLLGLRGVKGSFDEVINRLDASGHETGAALHSDISKLSSFLPLVFILLLVIAAHVELHYALAVTVGALFLFYRYGAREVFKALRYGFALDVPVLIFGAMLFKFTMENSGAVANLNIFFTSSGIPVFPILFLLPFITGLLTGLTVGFVGSTFPLILSLAGGAHVGEIAFAFASGFAGVLLSPVHLCLVLTKEYFKADMWGIYRKAVIATAVILAGAAAEYLVMILYGS